MQAKQAQDVTSNSYVTDAASIRAPKIALLKGRGPVCWDGDFYLQHNRDLPAGGIATVAQAWDHYLTSGQFEGRPSRYTHPLLNFTWTLSSLIPQRKQPAVTGSSHIFDFWSRNEICIKYSG